VGGAERGFWAGAARKAASKSTKEDTGWEAEKERIQPLCMIQAESTCRRWMN
jgi:hypothetical protein